MVLRKCLLFAKIRNRDFRTQRESGNVTEPHVMPVFQAHQHWTICCSCIIFSRLLPASQAWNAMLGSWGDRVGFRGKNLSCVSDISLEHDNQISQIQVHLIPVCNAGVISIRPRNNLFDGRWCALNLFQYRYCFSTIYRHLTSCLVLLTVLHQWFGETSTLSFFLLCFLNLQENWPKLIKVK